MTVVEFIAFFVCADILCLLSPRRIIYSAHFTYMYTYIRHSKYIRCSKCRYCQWFSEGYRQYLFAIHESLAAHIWIYECGFVIHHIHTIMEHTSTIHMLIHPGRELLKYVPLPPLDPFTFLLEKHSIREMLDEFCLSSFIRSMTMVFCVRVANANSVQCSVHLFYRVRKHHHLECRILHGVHIFMINFCCSVLNRKSAKSRYLRRLLCDMINLFLYHFIQHI